MNHIQRAQKLASIIPKLKKIQDAKLLFNEYVAHKEILKGTCESLTRSTHIGEELRDRGNGTAEFKNSALGLQREVRKIATSFRDDRTVILAPENVDTFWQPLKKMPKKVEGELAKMWKTYVESRIPSGQDEILGILSLVQGFEGQTTKVKSLRAAIIALGRDLPGNGSFSNLDNLTAQVAQAWNDLNGDGLPQTVLQFLKKAHQKSGFSLADLDADVLQWLVEKGLLNKYVVRGASD